MHPLISTSCAAFVALLSSLGVHSLVSASPAADPAPPAPLSTQKSSTAKKANNPTGKAASPTATPKTQPEKPAEFQVSSLGSLSLGSPNHGLLLNGVRPPEGKLFELVSPDFAWGTEETVQALIRATEIVHQKHPDTPPLHVGHLSSPQGGPLSPHLSHQSGRDVDLGFYYSEKRTWYRRATQKNLDVERTWTLIEAFITESDVEMILVDRSLFGLLRDEAKERGHSEAWLHSIFRGQGKLPAIIRHAPGHATHLHVRFHSPESRTRAQKAYPLLVEKKLIQPFVAYTHHTAKKGDTLGRLAKRYGVSVQAIQRANGLRSTLIVARRVYKIPRPQGIPPAASNTPITAPPRRLPPRSSLPEEKNSSTQPEKRAPHDVAQTSSSTAL